jgi:Sec7-like guanine-nucleotide exchange factor
MFMSDNEEQSEFNFIGCKLTSLRLSKDIIRKHYPFEPFLKKIFQYMDLDEFLNASCVADSQHSTASSEKSESNWTGVNVFGANCYF